MIRRIKLGQFHLKEQSDGQLHLYLQGKPIHPITERVRKLKQKDICHVKEVARMICHHSPFVDSYDTSYQNHYGATERHLNTIYEELLRLNMLKQYINEQLEVNTYIQLRAYSSVHFKYDYKTGQPHFYLKHFDKLPLNRKELTTGNSNGFVMVFCPKVIKYVDIESPTDYSNLYGNYLLVVKP